MKRLLPALLALISTASALPAFAGPDWQVIEHGRKVKLERLRHAAAAEQAAAAAKDAAAPTLDARASAELDRAP